MITKSHRNNISKKRKMKKIYLLFLFNAAMQYATAQPTITTLPKAGDVITSEFANTTGIQPGASGANITWDYSDLTDSAAGGTTKIINAAGTPYISDFTGATLASVVGDTLFSYFKIQSGVEATFGIEAPNEKGTYSHPFSLIHYPFTYPNSFYEKDTLYLQAGMLKDTTVNIDTFKVTGYGTLKLPGHSFNNVLQARQIEVTQGRTYIPGFGEIISPAVTDTTYAYYIDGQPGPLLFYNIENGGINLITYDKNSLLPLYFISFTAAPVNGDVQLNWQTGDESNTGVFNIQRSTDGSAFNNIGEVAAGRSGSHNYSYTDAVLPGASVIYYRLQETDLNGRSMYSDIVACNLHNFAGVTLYPNPANTNITISGTRNYSSLKIFNLAGQQLKYYTINGESITVPVAALVAGVYIAELSDGTKTTQIKFLKK